MLVIIENTKFQQIRFLVDFELHNAASRAAVINVHKKGKSIIVPLMRGNFTSSRFLLMLKLEDPCRFSFLSRFPGPENFDLFSGTSGTGGGALFALALLEACKTRSEK